MEMWNRSADLFWVETEQRLNQIKAELAKHDLRGLNDVWFIHALAEDVAFDLNCSESQIRAVINRMREAA